MFQKTKIFSGSALKLIAAVTMLIDHTAHILLSNIPDMNSIWFTFLNYPVSVYTLCRLIGRVAFPLYGFLLTEGFQHTHDRKKYALNLLMFALLSEIPWNLEHTGTIYYQGQNVFFTLFLGLLYMMADEAYSHEPQKQMFFFLLISLTALLLRADYGLRGAVFLFLLYLLKEKPMPRAVVCSSMLSSPAACIFAFIPVSLYNHERGFIQGKLWKYAFYAFYPVHMLILYLIKCSVWGY